MDWMLYSFDEAVQRFSVLEPYYPIWIDVYVKEPGVIEMKTSMRYRGPSSCNHRIVAIKRTEIK